MHVDPARFKRVAWWVAAFVMPLVTVQFAQWVTGGAGPARAHAGTADGASQMSTFLLAQTESPQWTSVHAAAVQRIEQLRREPFGPTPMFHTAARQVETPVVVRPGETDSVTELRLQAVISGSGNQAARAIINGRLHAIGQPVHGTNWIVSEIHAESRRVILAHPRSQRMIELRLTTPTFGGE